MFSHRFSHFRHSPHHFHSDDFIVVLIIATVTAFYVLALPVILYGPQAFALYSSAFRQLYKLCVTF
jgi:hypothetical protein